MSESMKIIIRKATMDDRQDLAEICESNTKLYDPIMPGAFLRQAEKFRENLPSNYNIQVVEIQKKVVGFIGTLELSKEACYLVALYFHKSYQRKGIGKFVLNDLANKNRNNEYEEIVLLVHKEANWAKDFYMKNGFVSISNTEIGIQEYRGGMMKSLHIPKTELMSLKL